MHLYLRHKCPCTWGIIPAGSRFLFNVHTYIRTYVDTYIQARVYAQSCGKYACIHVCMDEESNLVRIHISRVSFPLYVCMYERVIMRANKPPRSRFHCMCIHTCQSVQSRPLGQYALELTLGIRAYCPSRGAICVYLCVYVYCPVCVRLRWYSILEPTVCAGYCAYLYLDRQADRQTKRQAGRQAENPNLTERQTVSQTDRQTDRHYMETQTGQKGRQTDRQTDITWTHRREYGQTDGSDRRTCR
jgi:hypothetical protein